MATEKIQRLAKQAEDALTLIYGPGSVVEKRDASNDLYFEVTKSGAGGAMAVVRFKTFPATTPDQLDGIGIRQREYAPHIVQVGLDRGAGSSQTLTFANVVAGDSFDLPDQGLFNTTFTAVAGAPVNPNGFQVGATDADTAANAAAAINAHPTVSTQIVASSVGAVLTVVSIGIDPIFGTLNLATTGSLTITIAAVVSSVFALANDMDIVNIVSESVKAGVETHVYTKSAFTTADFVDANLKGVYRNREYPTQQV